MPPRVSFTKLLPGARSFSPKKKVYIYIKQKYIYIKQERKKEDSTQGEYVDLQARKQRVGRCMTETKNIIRHQGGRGSECKSDEADTRSKRKTTNRGERQKGTEKRKRQACSGGTMLSTWISTGGGASWRWWPYPGVSLIGLSLIHI